MFNNFFSKNCTIYETMWKPTVQPDRPQTIIWHMHIAYWIAKATNTHPECVIIIDFPLQQWWHKCTSMLCYMYFICLLVSFEVNSLDLSFTGFHSIFTECLPKVRQKLQHVRCTIHTGTKPTLIQYSLTPLLNHKFKIFSILPSPQTS
jgi:hypothetical protein